MKKSLPILLFSLMYLQLFAQDKQPQLQEVKENFLFKKIAVNYSFVNLGMINYGSLPLNFAENRYYMLYSGGIETSILKRLNVRIDYFSSYVNWQTFSKRNHGDTLSAVKNFFNPSIITIAPRFFFPLQERVSVFIDLKVGLAFVNSADSSFELINKSQFVPAFRTGLIANIWKSFSFGFSFDNLFIWHKFKYQGNYNGYNTSRISVLTTDLIYLFKIKK